MAATRLIALHKNKGKSVAACLKSRTDYVQNPDKTEQGELVSCYECSPLTVDEEFMLSKRQYELATGRRQKSDIIAYQIRQSFKPGEITAEEANKVGYELAMRFTKGKYAFIVATHTDRHHIHNHVIFNSTALDGSKKFRDFFFSALAVQRLSDLICLEHQLSVIEIKPYRERQKRTLYPPKESNRDRLCGIIDSILAEKPKDYEDFLQKLEQQGYEVKRGKYTSVKGARQKRFIRFKTLGAGYSEDELQAVIAGKTEHRPRQTQPFQEPPFQLLVDIQAKLSEGKSEGYARWAKKYNLKEMSKTLIFLQEHKIGSADELNERTAAATEKYHHLGDSIKAAETRMAEIAVLKTHIVNYAKTHPVYDAYRKAGYSKKFLDTHREEITLHKAAKAAFDETGLKKLPKVKALNADRNTLWNAAEAVEKQWNSQLARRWVLTIPREIPPDQYAVLVREFCEQQFVSKGMIVDFAIHDPYPPGHNPHAHVLLTMRAMDEHGKWLPKSSKVYDLDEKGERIKLPSGRWKSHKEDTVDWNDQKYCEIWRHEWEVIQNRYLEANDRPERVDLRSYARQGLDIVPTVHEGAAVRQMEKRGIQTNIGNLNREIRAANRLMKSIRQLIQNLKGWITELGEKRKELLAQKAAEEATLLPNLLMKYMEIRKEERKDWTRAGQNRGTSQDLKAVSEALSYLRQKGLSTVEDLEAFLESSGKSAADYRNQMKPKEARSKVIDGILASRTDCKECKPVYEKYQKIFFKKTKEKFKQEHPEVARYAKAAAYLAKHPDDKDKTKKELQQEQETLLSEIAELKVPLTEVQEDLKKLRDIRYWVRKATPGTEESKEPPKKQPIKEVLQDKADEKRAQKNAPAQTKHKQQDMEL